MLSSCSLKIGLLSVTNLMIFDCFVIRITSCRKRKTHIIKLVVELLTLEDKNLYQV